MTSVQPESLVEGRFQLLEKIGEGGMATVYRAFDQRLRRTLAIKVLSPALAGRPSIRSRFLAEARAMARLGDARVVRVLDMGEEGDRAYIIMELVEGGSLLERVRDFGPLPPRMAARVVLEVCEGLQYAHDGGIIHRDVKPHNILLTRTGEIRITDFGIAQVQDEDGHQMTRTGAVMGTWGFMAPEQKNDARKVDHRADIYSVGATLWSLLTGDTPPELFMADSEPHMLDRVPEELAAVVRRATRYRKEDRYPSLREMAASISALLALMPEDPPDAVPLVPPRAPSRPVVAPSTLAQLSGSAATGVASKPSEEETVPRPSPFASLDDEGDHPATIVPTATMVGTVGRSAPEPSLPRPVGSESPPPPERRGDGPRTGDGPRLDLSPRTGDGPRPEPTIRPAAEVPLPPPPPPEPGAASRWLVMGGLAVVMALVIAAGFAWLQSQVPAVPGGDAPLPTTPVEAGPTPGEVLPAEGLPAAAPPSTGTSAATPALPGAPGPAPSPPAATPAPAGATIPAVVADAAPPPTEPVAVPPPVTAPAAPVEDAPAAAVDALRPTLSVTAPGSASVGGDAVFVARAPADWRVKLYYRPAGAPTFQEKVFVARDGAWAATLRVDEGMAGGVEFFVEASDGSNRLLEGKYSAPLFLAVQP